MYFLVKIISAQSEASVLQQASEKIQEIVKSKLSNSESILKAKFQEQVRIGEITPFQAVEKESNSKKASG